MEGSRKYRRALGVAVCAGWLSAGCGSDEPLSEHSVERTTVAAADKLDLLLMIDNSISMADKQQQLRVALPQLVTRLIDPRCVVPGTDPPEVTASSSAGGCPEGSELEFPTFEDVHIGVVTSSLGSGGGVLCTPEHGSQYWNESHNDRGRLISRAGPDFAAPPATWNDQGFLAWDPAGGAANAAAVPGESDPATLVANFENLVTGAGEQGCGFEASLEAWYRFLIDPDPPLEVQYDPERQETVTTGVDDVLLTQRAQFLRPDSAVAIIMLTDDNDCSIIDHGLGYLVGNTDEGAMPRAAAVCDVDPNDPCCLSCIQEDWPSECGEPATDSSCQQGLYHRDVDRQDDSLCLRCWQQKRRFGLDLLHPTSRYVEGLTHHELITRNGETVRNPLYAPNPEFYPDLLPRLDGTLVFLVGIVGVPWQDIATDDSLDPDSPTLRYLSADEITEQGIWGHILGEPTASPPIPPSDPFMVESIGPRSGINPRTAIPISPPVTMAGGNPINGHEYQIENQCNLQYACIFPLATPRDCATAQPGQGCDCKVSNQVFDRPLCEDTVQYFAKAYPSPRILQVLQDYGSNAVVASICPKHPVCDDPASIDCGYNPVTEALLARVQDALGGTCLGRPLPADEQGQVPCRVVEVTNAAAGAPCDDAWPGRGRVDDELRDVVLGELREHAICGGGAVSCDDFSLCRLTPVAESADDPAYRACLHSTDPSEQTATGYCYLDARTDRNDDGEVECNAQCYAEGSAACDCLGNPDLVADCPAARRRRLRFVSPPDADPPPVPWPNAMLFTVCPE